MNPTNSGKVTRFPQPRYEAQGADDFTDREGCVCRACRRARMNPRRRHDDRADARVIATRATYVLLVLAACFGILYGFGETLRGVW